jgi:peptide/nickel transport system substrate-binding protein
MFLIPLLVIITTIFAACGGQAPAAPTAAPAAEPTAAPAAPTAAPAAEPTAAPAPTEAPAPTDADIPRNQTLIFDIDGGRVADPELWNPFVPGGRRDHGFHQAILEPLFILNYQTGEIEPWVGESMTYNDTLDVWTLKLRQGVTWSDGVPMTANDVVFTINMLKDKPELSNGADMQQWVKEVKKIDDLTVGFTLTAPNPRFQLDYFSVKIWGGVNIVPEHIWKDQDPLTFKNYDPAKGWPVGTGAYKLASVSPTEFTYLRDDNWWGAKSGFKSRLPNPKKLVWNWAGPEEKRVALMADNQLDSLMDITLGAYEALKAKNPNAIAWYQDLPYATLDPCSRTFEFNTTVEPWNDPEMRWAINYIFDRDQIVAIAYEGTTVKSRHFFPAYAPLNRLTDLMESNGMYEKYPLWTNDVAKAEEIFTRKGYTKGANGYWAKDGKELTLTITTHEAFIEKQRIAQVQVEQLQAAGVNATQKNEAGGTWFDNFALGTFESRMAWQGCGSINEPWASMNNFNTSRSAPVGERANGNGWRWENAEYSALVDQIGSLPLGDPKIDSLFLQAMDIWMKDLPIIPITQAKKLIPLNTTYWQGWPTADDPWNSSWTWWQSTHVLIHAVEPTGN